MTTAYDIRRARRDKERERAFHGETLAQYHARETAKPPTLAEIYRTFPKARCPWTVDFVDELAGQGEV